MSTPSPELPTRDQLDQLPDWDVAELAGRCAERVAPLFSAFWPDAAPPVLAALERSLHGLSQREFPSDADHASLNIEDVVESADAAGMTGAATVASAVSTANVALSLAGLSARSGIACHATIENALSAAALANPAYRPLVASAITRDFDLLVTRGQDGVPRAPLGALWHETPAGWPAVMSDHRGDPNRIPQSESQDTAGFARGRSRPSTARAQRQ
jgi:hypothetical protein